MKFKKKTRKSKESKTQNKNGIDLNQKIRNRVSQSLTPLRKKTDLYKEKLEEKKEKEQFIRTAKNAWEDKRADSFTQDFCPLEKIVGGVIKTKDGRYVNIVEIEPITFLLRSKEEQEMIVSEFYSWLKIAPIKLQFQVKTTYTDSSEIIEKLREQTKDETNKAVLKRRDELMAHVENLASKEAITKKFYIIYEYEGDRRGKKTTEEEIIREMNMVYNTIVSHFGAMGNAVVQHENNAKFVGEVLYKALNPRSSRTEKFASRIDRILTDNQFVKNNFKNIYDIPESYYVAPRGIDFTHTNYNIIDGMYVSYLYVKRDGYRNSVPLTWFEALTNFGEGVTVNLYAIKRDRFVTMGRVSRAMRMRRAESHDSFRSAEAAEELHGEEMNARFIRTRMSEGGEDLYDTCTLLTITADTKRALNERIRHIKQELEARDIFTSETIMHMEEAAMMSLPLLCIEKRIFEKSRRNFLTSSLASTYMWTAFEVMDTEGVIVGLNGTGSLVVTNPFNNKKFPNGNFLVVGSSGFGKSFFLMNLAYNIRLANKQVFVILPEKGHEWIRLTKAIGGTYIELAPGSSDCINLMEIRPETECDLELTADGIGEEGSLLTKKIHQIITFLQLNRKQTNMTDEEEAEISTVLTTLYANYGITQDNESIWEDKEKRILKKMPIIGDFYEAALENKVLKERVAIILKAYVEGDSKNMNRQTNVNLNNKFVVISVSKADRKMSPYAFLAMDYCYSSIKEDRTQNKILVLDECWRLLENDSNNNDSTNSAGFYLSRLFKLVRGYGGAIGVCTQEIRDVATSKHGSAIVNNARLKFILGMEKHEIQHLDDVLTLSKAEKQVIMRQRRGSALFVANDDKVSILIRAPKEWIKYFSTNAEQLKQIANEKKDNKE